MWKRSFEPSFGAEPTDLVSIPLASPLPDPSPGARGLGRLAPLPPDGAQPSRVPRRIVVARATPPEPAVAPVRSAAQARAAAALLGCGGEALIARHALPRGDALLARFEGRAAGVVVIGDLGDGAAALQRLCVSRAAAGKGVAQALLEALAAHSRGAGWRTLLAAPGWAEGEAGALLATMGFASQRSGGRLALDLGARPAAA